MRLAGAILRDRHRRCADEHRRAPPPRPPLASSICAEPLGLDDRRRAARPEAYIFSNTSLAVGPLIVPLSTSRIKLGERVGRQRHRARSSIPSSFSLRVELAHDPVARGLGVAGRGGRRLEVVRERRATASGAPASYSGSAYCATNRRRRASGSSGSVRRGSRRSSAASTAAAAGPARESSGSRALLPCCASTASGRVAGSHSRVSCSTRPPLSSTRDLPLDLVLERVLHVAERVEVLDLGLDAEGLRPGAAHRHVGVAAQAALLHVAVVHAERDEDLAQPAEELGRVGGRAQVRLG